jgi:hypothetical protein
MNNSLYALMVEKPFVLRADISYAKQFFKMLDRREGKNAHGKVALYIDGYNDVVEELFEIPEVKKWIRKLINEVPHLWYYIYRENTADIAWIMNCLSDKMQFVRQGEVKPISSYPLDEIDKLPKILVHASVSKHVIKNMIEKTVQHANRMGDPEGGIETITFIDEFFNINEG